MFKIIKTVLIILPTIVLIVMAVQLDFLIKRVKILETPVYFRENQPNWTLTNFVDENLKFGLNYMIPPGFMHVSPTTLQYFGEDNLQYGIYFDSSLVDHIFKNLQSGKEREVVIVMDLATGTTKKWKYFENTSPTGGKIRYYQTDYLNKKVGITFYYPSVNSEKYIELFHKILSTEPSPFI